MKEFILELIKHASLMALEYKSKLNEIDIAYKSSKDLVTEADQAIEKYLRKRVKEVYPNHVFLGEEFGEEGEGAHRWIVDPIDGTSSFAFDQPFFSISIAYEVNGVVEWACVHSPVLQETFLAQRGHGATLNNKPIHVSRGRKFHQVIMATGFACIRSNLEKNNLPYLNELLPQISDIRRFGSAALDLAYVAAGRLDGFWELNLNLYDIAAGKLIVEEAGGKVTDFSGRPISDCHEVFASNGEIHSKVIELFSKIEG